MIFEEKEMGVCLGNFIICYQVTLTFFSLHKQGISNNTLDFDKFLSDIRDDYSE